MPIKIRKLPNQDLYRVYNTETKVVHSYATTLENAKKQVTLLNMVDAGVPLQPLKKVAPNERMKRVEISGGNFAEDGKNLKPIFGRVGSKFSLIEEILKVIPPHTTYVEAFIGGGSIFWNKSPAKKSVINDLDKELVDAYRNLKSAPLSQLQQLDYLDKPADENNDGYKTPAYKKIIAELVSNLDKINSKSPEAKKLLKYFKIIRGTFNQLGKGKIYKNIDFKPYIAKLDEYKRLIKDTTITNKDYIDVIKEYDSPDTFFFLDPPYENSDTLYKNDTINYEEMRDVLKSIKGKFLLTINDSPNIVNIFKKFNQKKVSVTNTSNNTYFETKRRKELFITNYNMKQGGSIETDRFEEDGIVSLPEFRSVKINLPTYMYKRLPDINGKPPLYRYKLVIPITSSRNLSSRKKETSLDINQKPVSKPNVVLKENQDEPTIDDFSPADREKIEIYYSKVKANERKNPDEIDKDDYKIVERGRPLPCDGNPVVKKSKVLDKPKPRGRPKNKPLPVVLEKEDLIDEDMLEKSTVPMASSKSKDQKLEALHKEQQERQKEYDLYRERHQKLQDMLKKPDDKKPKSHKEQKYDKGIDILENGLLRIQNTLDGKVAENDINIITEQLDNVLKGINKLNEDDKKRLTQMYNKVREKLINAKAGGMKVKSSSVSKDNTYDLYEDIFGKPAVINNSGKSKEQRLEEINKEREERRKELDRKKQQQKSIVGKGLKNNISTNNMANKWVQYVKEYASKNGISYRDALRDPRCKEGYKKGGSVVKRGRGVVDELGNQDLIAIAYDDSELGANAGKKYISL